MSIRCAYPAMSKGKKKLPNFLIRAETSIILIYFEGFLYHVSDYTVTLSYHLLYIHV